MPENNSLSASLGSGTVSKTDSRGFDTSRRRFALARIPGQAWFFDNFTAEQTFLDTVETGLRSLSRL
jgi:hypothetical protein